MLNIRRIANGITHCERTLSGTFIFGCQLRVCPGDSDEPSRCDQLKEVELGEGDCTQISPVSITDNKNLAHVVAVLLIVVYYCRQFPIGYNFCVLWQTCHLQPLSARGNRPIMISCTLILVTLQTSKPKGLHHATSQTPRL